MKSAIVAALAALSLMGCSSMASAQAPTPNSINVAPPNFQMPSGEGCAGDIARYRAVQDDDLAMGQIAPRIYNQIHAEIEAAAKECSDGHDARARQMVLTSRKRHGYPTAL